MAAALASAAALAAPAHAADAAGSVTELLTRLKTKDDKVRGPAWQGAAPFGAPAVKPLADLMTDADFETARMARRALQKIVRHAGRPGAGKEREAVERELIAVLKSSAPVPVRREVAWLLSEIGGDDSVAALAPLLGEVGLREDARCALERIPGGKATAALKKGLDGAPEEFRYALANSLRVRGEKIAGYPSRKLVPTRATSLPAKQ